MQQDRRSIAWVLTGERVLVRPWSAADAPALWEAADSSRDHLAPWMPWIDAYRSPADAEAFIQVATEHWATGADLWVAIVERASGRILGGSGYNTPNWAVRSFEIGYWLRADATGRGFVTEAARLLVDGAFEMWSARRLELRCDPRNAASRAVAERLGFRLEGHLRRNQLDGAGQPRDTLVYGLTDLDRAMRDTVDLHRT